MAGFNGSGTFERNYNWVTDDGNGINIVASRMDTEDDGFATGLSNCITKDGQTTITANIPFNSKKITGLANGSARTDSIALGQVQDNSFGTLGTLGGSADTYTANPSPSITAYATGMEFNLKVNADNTGASTLNVSAIDAKDIKKYDGAGSKVDLEAGDLQQDQYYKVIYDGTDFIVLGKNPATTTNKGISLLPKPITIANNSTDAEHDIDFGAGVMQFDDGSGQAITNAWTKQFDSTFALGNNAGGMVSGESLPTDGLVYMFAISTADGTLTDIIGTTTRDGSTISGDSVVSTNSLTKKQYLGAFATDASDNILAGQYFVNKSGYRFQYKDYILVDSDSDGYASRTAIDMRVPPNAVVNFLASAGSSNSTLTYTLYTNLNDTDSTPSLNNCNIVTNVNFAGFGQFFEITNDNGEIGKRSSNTLTSSNNTRTKGWEEKY